MHGLNKIFLRPIWLWFCLALLAPVQAETSLRIGPSKGLKISQSNGVWNLSTESENPHFWTSAIPNSIDPEESPVLTFEYFSLEDLPEVQVRVPLQSGEVKHLQLGTIRRSEAWQSFRVDLRSAGGAYAVDGKNHFALILGTSPGHEFKLRKLALGAPTAQEQESVEAARRRYQARLADAEAYEAYLGAMFPAGMPRIEVGKDSIAIQCSMASGSFSRMAVVEYPVHVASYTAVADTWVKEGERDYEVGEAVWRLPRFDGKRDRATSRWRVLGLNQEGDWDPLTAAHYPSQYAEGVQRDLQKMEAAGIKGLGGIPPLTPDHEIFELGIHHATVNIILNALISEARKPGMTPWAFEGKTYFLNPGYRDQLDNKVRLLSRNDIVVSAILLVANTRNSSMAPANAMIHPDSLPEGKFAMPNLAEEQGAELYRAAIHFLVERYTRALGGFGRISNWIMHNEIDQAGTWTNMGDQPVGRYLEAYMRSVRLVYHSARRFDPHARVFISLTHYWTRQSPGNQTYVVRDLLDLFAESGRAEGDFEWGVAYHPYPKSLRVPEVWDDEVAFDVDAEYITPRNIEVLPAYLSQERFLYQGSMRGILLSEQGINARSLSPEDQRVQAAGIVYTMNRIRLVPEIEAFHYHGYRDAPEAEGGLLLGLVNAEIGRKQSWEVYRAIGSDDEPDATAFAWPLMGMEGPEQIQLEPLQR